MGNVWRFLSDGVTESIATTFSSEGDPNIAPMGLYVEGETGYGAEEETRHGVNEEKGDGRDDSLDMGVWTPEYHEGRREVRIRLFEGSDTYRNIESTGRVTVNFCRDPLIYAKGALEGFDSPGEMIDDRHLSCADGWIDCDTSFVEKRRDGDVDIWRLEPRKSNIERETLFTVDRGFNSVIEASVHATRVGFKPELEELLEHHLDIARRCGGRRVQEAVALIEENIRDG